VSAARGALDLFPSSLAQLEERIQKGLRTFIDVGLALAEIRDRRLYKEAGYSEFDTYCRKRWGWSEAYVTRNIQAAELARALPIGNGPKNEAQARELVPLAQEDEHQVLEVWDELREEYGDDVTARVVRSAVDKRLRRKRRIENAAALEGKGTPAFPDGRYKTLVADPPWRYESPGVTKADARHFYPTLSVDEICALGVTDLATEDAHLWLWATNALVYEAHEVARAWGFKPVTMLTWCKRGPGVGNYLRNNTEHAILATRGTPMTPRDKPTSSWFIWPRGQHSEKPEAFYSLVQQVRG
jgi:N6-adenosine-specific RNA methylase IME4